MKKIHKIAALSLVLLLGVGGLSGCSVKEMATSALAETASGDVAEAVKAPGKCRG